MTIIEGHRRRARLHAPAAACLAATFFAGCDGPQSALTAVGSDAVWIAELFWWMAGGALVVWALVLAVAVYATRFKGEAYSERAARLFIVGGGVVFPTVVLTVLLIYGLSMMPDLLAPGREDGVRVHVTGEQWWWRVRYITPDGESVELANEIRLPVGYRMAFVLDSPDVIHSFWVPSLAGKVDMVPGRVNVHAFEATKTGTFRGACAEFCGTAHALMSFYTVVLEPDAFEAWLAHQAEPARAPTEPLAIRGAELFLSNGCGACHTIRGTDADGTVGPDLTHVGSRVSLGAGILDNDVDEFVRWIAHTGEIKPDVHMPSFHMLADDDLLAIATYLDGLR